MEQPQPDLKQVVVDVLTFLRYHIERLQTFHPPAIDDFITTRRASWEHWTDRERRGGYVQWPRGHPLTETQMIRLVAFVELVADHPAHAWLHETLKAFAQYGPYIPSTSDDGTVWDLHPQQERFNMPQAIILRTLHGLLADTEELSALPNSAMLGAELDIYLHLEELVQRAIAERRREIETELSDKGDALASYRD